jgi:hypothetical protein
MAGPPAVRHPARGLAGLITVGEVADWASIVALIISCVNALLIFSVKRRIVLNVTLGPLFLRLRENSESMNRCLSEFGIFSDTFNEQLGRCEANVNAVRRRLGHRRSAFCKGAQRSILEYRRRKSVDAARDVYNDLQRVLQEVENRVEEQGIVGP